jgi:hypothetical protein
MHVNRFLPVQAALPVVDKGEDRGRAELARASPWQRPLSLHADLLRGHPFARDGLARYSSN